MGWTSRQDLERWFSTADPTFEQVEVLGRIRTKAKELAGLILELTPANADQSAAMRKLREAEWSAQAAVLHHRRPPAGPNVYLGTPLDDDT